jgi:arylsulfatase A-like enzyme
MDHPEFPVGKGFKYVQERYDAEVKFTDQHIGKLLDGLRAAGLAENTAVVVFSDHGEAFGEHKLGGEALYFHGEALYNEVLKVPLLIYVPGMTPRVVTERAMLIDMAPTVLELAGVARPGSFRGRSLLAAMRGEATPGPIPPAYAEMLPCTAWQKNERVLINTVGGEELAIYAKYTDNLTELYSLADDATQQRNVSSKKPEQTRAMQQALAPYLRIKPDGGR